MQEGKTKDDYMNFKADVTNMPLRYKIIVNRNLVIAHVLYNTGKCIEEIPFEEFRFKSGAKITI